MESESKWDIHLLLGADLKPVKWCLTCHCSLLNMPLISLKIPWTPAYGFLLLNAHFFPQHIAFLNQYLQCFDLKRFYIHIFSHVSWIKIINIRPLYLLSLKPFIKSCLFPLMFAKFWAFLSSPENDEQSVGVRFRKPGFGKILPPSNCNFFCQLLHFSQTQFPYAWRGYGTGWVETIRFLNFFS